jgi:hypothetical protein
MATPVKIPVGTTCALCRKEPTLCDSHIIPEFAYTAAYEEKHRVHALPGHEPEQSFFLQKGLRFPLLCQRCEGFLNTNYEDPFKRFWLDGQQLAGFSPGETRVILGIDYAKFKLFHLSILWRASVCAHPAFDFARLGRHADEVREMLLAHDPGPGWLFPIAGGALIDDDDGVVAHGLVATPLAATIRGHPAYVFAFCGCRWFYFRNSKPVTEAESIQLKEDGSMEVQATSLRSFFREFFDVSRRSNAGKRRVDAKRIMSQVPRA